MKVCPEIVRTLCAEFRPLSVDWGATDEQLRAEIDSQKQVFLVQQAGLKLEEGRLKENS